jgi:uncharacterized protein YeaO (DUF488 family)
LVDGGSSQRATGKLTSGGRLILLQLKRAYETPAPGDGERVLVERLWPRGLSKPAAAIDLWLKDVAPSTELRKWFNHERAKWPKFQQCDWEELKRQPEVLELLRTNARRGRVTLIYAARDQAHNGALALKAFLERKRPKSRAEIGKKS